MYTFMIYLNGSLDFAVCFVYLVSFLSLFFSFLLLLSFLLSFFSSFFLLVLVGRRDQFLEERCRAIHGGWEICFEGRECFGGDQT